MRILVDECLPRQLKAWIGSSHQAETVQECGWTNVKNGTLLRLADEAGFDVLVTADKNMYFQQNFEGRRVSAVVIPTNRKLLVQKCVPAFLQSLDHLRPGEKVVMDLGDDANAWETAKIHAITADEHHTTHIFRPAMTDPKSR